MSGHVSTVKLTSAVPTREMDETLTASNRVAGRSTVQLLIAVQADRHGRRRETERASRLGSAAVYGAVTLGIRHGDSS